MTIVAYKEGVIASDSQASQKGLRMGHIPKIGKNASGDICGASGDTGWCAAFIKWFEGGEDGSMPTVSYADVDACDMAIVIRADSPHKVWFLPSCKFAPSEITISGPQGLAIGSGKSEAMGAMFAGATAEDAVAAAIALDDGCGGPIQVKHLGL